MHKERCNTVIHFECCKSYFPCHYCHNERAEHEAVLVKPSSRKCLVCGKVFSVGLATTQPVNCKNCVGEMVSLLSD